MDDLVQWLRAQLDEDERIARAASAGPWSTRWNGQDHELVAPSRTHPIAEWTYTIVTQEPGASTQRTECDTADADHIARHDPARVLREVEAKRQVLAKYTKAVERMAELAALCERLKAEGKDTFMPEMDRATAIHRRDVLGEVLQLLALPYSDRSGYREEWRP